MKNDSILEKLNKLNDQSSQSIKNDSNNLNKTKSNKKGFLYIIYSILVFVLLKGKFLLAGLKLAPLLTTLSTMALSIFIYSKYYGISLAAGIVLLIFVHELGHGFAAKLSGLKVSVPIFIPFFGAFIALKDHPKSSIQDAVIAFGGPLLGFIGGLIVLFIGINLSAGHYRNLFIVTAWFSFMINFFNLMPVFKLDGDRISQPFYWWYWIPGSMIIIILCYFSYLFTKTINPFILFILILGIAKSIRIYLSRTEKLNSGNQKIIDKLKNIDGQYIEENKVKSTHRIFFGISYYFLCVLLFCAMMYSEKLKPAL